MCVCVCVCCVVVVVVCLFVVIVVGGDFWLVGFGGRGMVLRTTKILPQESMQSWDHVTGHGTFCFIFCCFLPLSGCNAKVATSVSVSLYNYSLSQ